MSATPSEVCRLGHEYVDRGWSPIPLGAGTKDRPLVKWKNRGQTSHDDVDAWWGDAGTCKGSNLAILTGWRSSLYVIDVDLKDGQPGLESLAAIEAQYGALPRSYRVATPSGGFHLYFRLRFPEPGAGPSWGNERGTYMGRPAPGIDVRAEGGYVVAPPSSIPGSGAYRLSDD